jgi:hypothetical protein
MRRPPAGIQQPSRGLAPDRGGSRLSKGKAMSQETKPTAALRPGRPIGLSQAQFNAWFLRANDEDCDSLDAIHEALNPGQALNGTMLWVIQQALDNPDLRAKLPASLLAAMGEGPDAAGR